MTLEVESLVYGLEEEFIILQHMIQFQITLTSNKILKFINHLRQFGLSFISHTQLPIIELLVSLNSQQKQEWEVSISKTPIIRIH